MGTPSRHRRPWPLLWPPCGRDSCQWPPAWPCRRRHRPGSGPQERDRAACRRRAPGCRRRSRKPPAGRWLRATSLPWRSPPPAAESRRRRGRRTSATSPTCGRPSGTTCQERRLAAPPARSAAGSTGRPFRRAAAPRAIHRARTARHAPALSCDRGTRCCLARWPAPKPRRLFGQLLLASRRRGPARACGWRRAGDPPPPRPPRKPAGRGWRPPGRNRFPWPGAGGFRCPRRPQPSRCARSSEPPCRCTCRPHPGSSCRIFRTQGRQGTPT